MMVMTILGSRHAFVFVQKFSVSRATADSWTPYTGPHSPTRHMGSYRDAYSLACTQPYIHGYPAGYIYTGVLSTCLSWVVLLDGVPAFRVGV